MNVAVVGGGIYGLTVALTLDDAGYDVDLFEKADDIITAASWANQWRLHRGYHYPRSPSTGRSCKQSAAEFRDWFPEAVIEETDHYYCIANERTKTTGNEYLYFCEQMDLPFESAEPDVVDMEKIDTAIQATENRIDPHALKDRLETELEESDIDLFLGTEVTDLDELSHDHIVVATYAGINELFDEQPTLRGRYKFQLVEKPVVKLPSEFDGTSLVVMDGPFMCFDPHGRTDTFLLGNVVHAIHETTVGERPDFDTKYDDLLNNGLVEAPEITKFDEFISSGTEFIPGLAEAEHLGSLYTTRTVLADVEATDERPTIVEREDDVFKIFAGKIASCIPAAKEIVSELEQEVTL